MKEGGTSLHKTFRGINLAFKGLRFMRLGLGILGLRQTRVRARARLRV